MLRQPEHRNGIWTSVLAIVLVVSVLGAGFAVAPLGAPGGVDVVTGQDTDEDQPTVTLANQSSNGSVVTIRNATLPEGGFIALHDSEYLGRAPADLTVIAISEYLSPGQHQNVTIDISNAPPGNYPGLNTTQLNTTQTVVAALYTDSNANQQFDYVSSNNEQDPAIRVDRNAISDFGRVRVDQPERERASAVFRNQTLENNTLVVSRARLPDGGFLTVQNETYQRTADPLTSTVGLSEYLSPGNHTNVTIEVLPGALNQSQTVTLRLAMDTNNNQQYDYIVSNGFNDTGYPTANRSKVVTETAQVRVPSVQPIPGQARNQTSANGTATPISDTPTTTPEPTLLPATTTPTTTGTITPESTTAPGNTGDSGGSLSLVTTAGRIIGVILLVGVMIFVIRVVR